MSKKDWKKRFMRMKQLANQNLGRVEKSIVLSEDLLELDRRVDQIRVVCQDTTRRLSACHPTPHNVDVDKRRRKLPQMVLSNSMVNSASVLGDDEDALGRTYSLCSVAQQDLAEHLFQYSMNVENNILTPLHKVLERDIPVIMKLRKQLAKLVLDMDSAKARYHSAVRQQLVSSSSNASLSQLSTVPNKADIIRQEMEEAENKVDQCRDQLVIEMYSFFAREGELSELLLTLLEEQTEYHRNALQSLESCLPKVREHIEQSVQKAVFGCSLESHLLHAGCDISFVIEHCVGALLQYGVNEEGLFRVAASGTRVKKLKAAFDANVVDLEEYKHDVHCIAGALKLYLRELPQPLMTYELYEEWMHLLEMSPSARQNSMWVVVDKLPKHNFNNLRYLIKFLARLAEHSDANKMTAANLAIVIAPSLLWPPCPDDIMTNTNSTLQTANAHSSIVEQLINKAEWFFPGDVDFCTTYKRQPSVSGKRTASPSSSHNLDEAVLPSSNESSVFLSLPQAKSRPSSSVPRFQMSNSLIVRNESWSSFSSLHSLPDSFFAVNRTGTVGVSRPLFVDTPNNLAIEDSNPSRNLDSGVLEAKKPAEMPPMNRLVYNKQMSYPGVTNSTEVDPCLNGYANAARATDILVYECVPEDTETLGAKDDRTLKSSENAKREFKMFEEKSLSKSFAQSTSLVFHNLMRAKSFTSKTLRRLNPKLSVGGKIAESQSENRPVHGQTVPTETHSSAQSNIFKNSRHKSLEPRLSIESTISSFSLPKNRGKSPNSECPVLDSDLRTSTDCQAKCRRALFAVGVVAEQDQSVNDTQDTRSMADRVRAASCVEHNNQVSTKAAAGCGTSVHMDPNRSGHIIHGSEPDILRAQPDFKRGTSARGQISNEHDVKSTNSPLRSRAAIDALAQPAVLASPESSSMSSESPTTSVCLMALASGKRKSETENVVSYVDSVSSTATYPAFSPEPVCRSPAKDYINDCRRNFITGALLEHPGNISRMNQSSNGLLSNHPAKNISAKSSTAECLSASNSACTSLLKDTSVVELLPDVCDMPSSPVWVDGKHHAITASGEDIEQSSFSAECSKTTITGTSFTDVLGRAKCLLRGQDITACKNISLYLKTEDVADDSRTCMVLADKSVANNDCESNLPESHSSEQYHQSTDGCSVAVSAVSPSEGITSESRTD